MNNTFFDIIRKYCLVEDIDFVFKNKSKDMCDVLLNFNDYVNNKFFDYKIHTASAYDYVHLPKTFIVEWAESYFLILQKEKNKIINLTSTEIVTQDDLLSKRIFYLSKELKDIDADGIFDALKKMTPRASYFSLGLIFFALMTPLYSNLFNTRLIYSNSYHSVFFVTGIFIIFVIFELIVKSIIYDRTAVQVRSNNIKCNAFFIYALKVSNCRNAAVKIRTIESSVVSLWESYPLISVDLSLAFLFVVCLFLMMGVYAFPLLIYYIALTFLCVYIRFAAYKKTLQTNNASYEKMSTLISLEEKRKELKFLRGTFFEKILMDKTNRDEYTKMEMNIENHHWAEMIKANSFISMIVMFISSYFAVINDTLMTASIIAIMIINSRLSGALVGGINKLYLSRLHMFHIKNSLSELLKDKDTFVSHSGIYISRIQQLSVEKLSISFAERKLIDRLSFTAAPGDFIGIVGVSGSGKSSLIKALSNSTNCYSGAVKLNNIDITHISEEYIQNCIAYHSTNSTFIKGTLRENFMIYSVVDDKDIIKILTLCCKNLDLSKENIDEKFVDELNLSNGEKQKILLCLALFKKPEIVFLDESTSYLSTADALAFLESIKNLYSDSIVVFATHDLSLQRLFTRKIELSHEKLSVVNNSTTINIPQMKLSG